MTDSLCRQIDLQRLSIDLQLIIAESLHKKMTYRTRNSGEQVRYRTHNSYYRYW